MNDFESRLRTSLTHSAQRAPAPSPLEGGTMKRIRARRTIQAVALGAVALLAIAGAATAIRLGDRDVRPPANHGENVGPYTHWLYALDANGLEYRNGLGGSRVLAVDPATGDVVRTFRGGYDPQMTLSPDGSRLFVISTRTPSGIDSYTTVIDAFDTKSGMRLSRTSLPELDGASKSRTLHKLPVFAPDFTTSLDGRRIYLGERTPRRGPVRASAYVGTYDTATEELLPNSVQIIDCDTGVFLPGGSADMLTVVCSRFNNHPTVPAKNFLYFLHIGDDGLDASPQRVDLPDFKEKLGSTTRFYENISWAAASADGNTVYAVTRDGHVYVVDATTRALVSEANLDVRDGFGVQQPAVLLGPDDKTMYVGIGYAGGNISAVRQVMAYDTTTWRLIAAGSIDPASFGIALGPGGGSLFAPTWEDPNSLVDNHSSLRIFDIDGGTIEQRGEISGVGATVTVLEVPRLGR
jgi:PQQ-like domain